MKVRSKDAADSPASFALLFVQNYAILDLSDKIYTGGWWIPKCSFFTALKSDNARTTAVPGTCNTRARVCVFRVPVHMTALKNTTLCFSVSPIARVLLRRLYLPPHQHPLPLPALPPLPPLLCLPSEQRFQILPSHFLPFLLSI